MTGTSLNPRLVEVLRSPVSGEQLLVDKNGIHTASGSEHYRISNSGIPLFAESVCSPEGKRQQAHYDRIARAYFDNLDYPHTQEYMSYLNRAFLRMARDTKTGSVAEICCGRGEAFQLLRDRIEWGLGVDVSIRMLEEANEIFDNDRFSFIQGDATMLPLAPATFDTVFMLGGIHHVQDRTKLFAEVFRVLKPGGRFCWREPVSDFILWRILRAAIYRLSPTLDHRTERPLLWHETVPPLEAAGFRLKAWDTYGFLGFCLFMNSDVLVFNRLFRFLPGIRKWTRAACLIDEWTRRLPGMRRAGLQVIGMAQRPEEGPK